MEMTLEKNMLEILFVPSPSVQSSGQASGKVTSEKERFAIR